MTYETCSFEKSIYTFLYTVYTSLLKKCFLFEIRNNFSDFRMLLTSLSSSFIYYNYEDSEYFYIQKYLYSITKHKYFCKNISEVSINADSVYLSFCLSYHFVLICDFRLTVCSSFRFFFVFRLFFPFPS